MIRGLDLFRGHFAEYRKAFVLIGGVACHEWLSTQGLEFRATKDMDMVLIVEAVDTAFVKRFWEFIEAGKYAGRFKADDDRQLYRYRFDKPADDKYPVMIEIFSRKPSNVDLAEGQQVVPIKEGKSKDIAKHRTDVFRIAATLPSEEGPAVPGAVQEDLRKFLSLFPPENKKEWEAIRAGLKTTFGAQEIKSESLIETIRTYFKLESNR